ncbi:MAG: hypothetical protein ACP5HJ_03770 [Candidatus Micrarchaeia archaeon]|jgi:hydroxymethylpyrimidine/phosphomethylpyrimidine kinase
MEEKERIQRVSFDFSNKKEAKNFLKEMEIKEMKKVKLKKILNGKRVKFIIKGKEREVEKAKNSLINDYNLILKIRRFLYGRK